jgi:AraC family transcriptional regulator
MEMDSTKLIIKNMVCGRCIKVVKEELEKAGLKVLTISLGEAVVEGNPESLDFEKIRSVLEENGFELLEDKKAKTIERIKIFVIKYIQDEQLLNSKTKFSKLLADELNLDYAYLSSLFSTTEQVTIEQYLILQKIEKAKELLKYGEDTLSEIAYRLGYKSVNHLSSQFKKITGMSASQFKALSVNERKPIDRVN